MERLMDLIGIYARIWNRSNEDKRFRLAGPRLSFEDKDEILLWLDYVPKGAAKAMQPIRLYRENMDGGVDMVIDYVAESVKTAEVALSEFVASGGAEGGGISVR